MLVFVHCSCSWMRVVRAVAQDITFNTALDHAADSRHISNFQVLPVTAWWSLVLRWRVWLFFQHAGWRHRLLAFITHIAANARTRLLAGVSSVVKK